MNEKLIRVFHKIDVNDIKEHMIIYGDLAGACSKCSEMGLKLDLHKCPKCGTDFKYVSFRNPKSHIPKIIKSLSERPSLKIIDFDDFKHGEAEQRAKDFLK